MCPRAYVGLLLFGVAFWAACGADVPPLEQTNTRAAATATASAPDSTQPSTPTRPTVAPPTVQVPSTGSSPTVAPAIGQLPTVSVERVFPNLEFRQLTGMAQANDGTGRFFVTEQTGRVLVFENRRDASRPEVFLDISDRVNRGHNEEGLLGLALDPQFGSNGAFYVYYSAEGPRRSVLSRFSASPDSPNSSDPDSEYAIMEIPQPYGNHNGGQLAFGPDGFLYVGLGDGGSSGDPSGNGQDPGTLLGSIIRIDVSVTARAERYRIPADNPFIGVEGARPEVWAYGLRNPWGFSFDSWSGQLWVGDVGQNSWEEIDIVESGQNYGWNVMEGNHCYPPGTACDAAGLQMPVSEYGRDDGCSVIGGYVHRGVRHPSLNGVYVYGDFCSGKVWGLRLDGQSVTGPSLMADTGLMITSFGQDLDGELYVLSRDSGIYRLVPES